MERLILPEPGLIVWTIITFGLLLVVLRVVAWKPILGVIEERERAIRESLDSSRRAREEAEAALEENRRILADARRTAGEIVQRGERDAERAKGEILEAARKEQEDVVRRARETIEREMRQAVREIRSVAADLALAAAEKLLEARMDEGADRRLVEKYLDELGPRAPRGGAA
jgi:F-type H+-transporting ATPase subunit b